MKQLIVVFGLLTALPAAAAEGGSSKPEAIGVGTGAVVGGFAAGPVGIIAGAALGALIGDRYHQEGEAKREATAQLQKAEVALEDLDQEITLLNNEAVRAELALQQEREVFSALVTDAINVSVLFKTDTAELMPETGDRLKRLAALLNEFSDSAIRIEGYADPRGEAAYNGTLSAQRAVAVRNALIDAGVADTRIGTVAHGEQRSTAQEGDLDSYALDRRVEISLVPPPTELASLEH